MLEMFLEYGETINVSLGLPAEANGAQATVTIKYADGSTDTKKIVYVNGMSDFPNSVTFSAKAAGNATVSATEILISDSSGASIETNGSTSASIVVGGETAPAAKTPEQATPTNTAATPAAPKVVTNPTFTKINETVYTTAGINVRSSCSTDVDNVIGGLAKGAEITRTGNAGGWSRILYNGKEAYVASRLLTTQKPEEPQNEVVNDTVENITNVVNENTLEKNVGVLPEVGTNYLVLLYIMLAICATLVSVYLYVYSMNEKINK